MTGQPSTDYSHLASQEISETGPGSILRDFEMLLGYVEDGLTTSGKYHLLPRRRLAEIDQRMTRPLRPRLRRPQQRSYPHLNGLYLLLRVTQIGIVEGPGTSRERLVLDSAVHEQWLQLNPTERYFTLFEAWLRRASWEVVGQRGGGWMNYVAMSARDIWSSIPARGTSFSEKDKRGNSLVYSVERSCTLALLEMFGLVDVQWEEPDEGQGWCIKGVNHTPFGDELLQFAFEEIMHEMLGHEKQTTRFGVWQAGLQPYFPEWVNNLTLKETESRDGVYYFKVSLGRPWRRIAIPASEDLDALANSIIEAFDFDGDHLYDFRYTARDGRRSRVEHPYIDDAEAHTDEMRVGELPLAERQSMKFLYDFGASWQFNVQLEKIDAQARGISEPTVVASHGEAPPEYGYDYE